MPTLPTDDPLPTDEVGVDSDVARSVLAVDGLCFRYQHGTAELFGGLSHTFTSGALTGVTGPSGRGKSTLLYVLGLMLTPTNGTVTVDGHVVSTMKDNARSWIRARRIGFVFQDAELDPTRTVLDSVIEPGLYVGRRRAQLRPRAASLLSHFGLGERASHRPGQISGGQAQRVAVCRSLMNSPDIVLADEPTGNLDRANAAHVLDALRNSAESHLTTVVIASHDPFVLDQLDEVVSL